MRGSLIQFWQLVLTPNFIHWTWACILLFGIAGHLRSGLTALLA
jgi:hypothetical protein